MRSHNKRQGPRTFDMVEHWKLVRVRLAWYWTLKLNFDPSLVGVSVLRTQRTVSTCTLYGVRSSVR